MQAGASGRGTPGDSQAAAEEVLFTVDRLVGEGDCEHAITALETGEVG